MMDDKMNRIIHVAIEAFAEKGFYRTKTDEIAEKAGVSKGLIFHYFNSKKNLYGQSVTFAAQQMEAELDYTLFPKDSLLALFEYSIKLKFQLAERYPHEIQLIMDAYGNLDNLPDELYDLIMVYINQTKEQSYQVISRIIENLPLKEAIKKEDVTQLVLMTFNQIELETKAAMSHQKITDLHFFDEIIQRASMFMRILETGFLITE